MNRNISVCIDAMYHRPIKGFETVSIQDIENLIHHSVNMILCDDLSLLDQDSVIKVVKVLMDKLALGGQLVLRFIDAKLLAKQYVAKIGRAHV